MVKQTMNFELSTYLGYFLYTVLPTGALTIYPSEYLQSALVGNRNVYASWMRSIHIRGYGCASMRYMPC